MTHQPRVGFFARFESRIDGAPIVVLVSRNPSSNRKTGPMINAAIVREDVAPHLAQSSGEDESVCGSCPLRPLNAKSSGGPRCYVITAHSIRAQWDAFKAGRYTEYEERWDKIQRPIRIGSYGDPCAVPFEFWKKLVRYSRGWTGYTHQWEKPENHRYRELLMASIDLDDHEGYERARRLGWRTFRVRKPDDGLLPGEFECPASIEAGHRTTCFSCGACDGIARGSRKVNPVVIVHGSGNQKFRKTAA